MSVLESGQILSTTLPKWQRDYYEMALLESIRINSVLVPYTQMVQDFSAVKTKRIVYTEVYDLEPNWNSVSESLVWAKGGSLDSRTVSIDLALYHNILKFSDFHDIVDFVNGGNVSGLINSKLALNLVETLDILARNAFLSHPYKIFAGGAANRYALAGTNLFEVDYAEGIRTLLHEDGVPGIQTSQDGAQATIVCVTTPRVIHDIRTAVAGDWQDAHNYAGDGMKFRSEVGSWGGVRFVMSNRLRLRNHGAKVAQTTLTSATVPGQGSAATVDSIYSPGQTGATTTIPVAASTNFSVGDWVTIHSQTVKGPGDEPVEADGTQETRRVVSKGTGVLSLNAPLLKDHAEDDFVTKGLDIHTSLFMGAPGVVFGVGENPGLIFPPKIDDAMNINRIGWRMFGKFQLFRPEVFRVVESAGSAALGQALLF